MSELPPNVVIGPFTYTVHPDQEAVNKMRYDATDARVGECDYKRLRIVVDTAFPRDQVADTILHESLHAIWEVARRHDDQEEEIISWLTPYLLDLIRRNPELIFYLAGVEA